MKLKLPRDHYVKSGDRVVKHLAGTEVDLPPEQYKHIVEAFMVRRRKLREQAAKIPGSPESQ